MAHFAEIDENDIVIKVIVVNNDVIFDENNIENEKIGIDFCRNLFGGRWVQTSYNNSFRKQFAGVGMKYDSDLDQFVDIE
jgi:hypothetical protein